MTRLVEAVRRNLRRVGLVLAVVVVAAKDLVISGLEHHPGLALVPLLLAMGVSVLRHSPRAIAATGGALAWLAVVRESLAGAFLVGFATYLVLMGVFLAIATALHARDRRRRLTSQKPSVPPEG